jgi:hypothetical protein
MKCTFTVGQRVVCINDEWPEWAVLNGTALIVPGAIRVPMLNEVLTIREIVACWSPLLSDQPIALKFHEIEGGWLHTHFRALIEKKTDIAIFQAMLTPAGRIPVDV